MAIILAYLGFISFMLMANNEESYNVSTLMFPALLVAAVGIWDDHGHVSPKVRLVFHFICAGFFLFLLEGIPNPFLGLISEPFLVALFFAFYLVWILNLYNFMDGIDGIAGIETITVCLLGSFLWWMSEKSVESYFPVALAMAARHGQLTMGPAATA